MTVSGKVRVFTREATGLVREVSPADSFAIGVTGIGVISIYQFYSQFMTAAPNDNPYLAIVFMGIPLLAMSAVYALLTMAFPRSGGEYVFNTRVIHPTLGLATDFLAVSTMPIAMASFALIAIGVIADMFQIEGFLTNSVGLTSIGQALVVPNASFAITTVLVIITMFFLIGRIKYYVRTQMIIVAANLAVVAILVGALALTPTATYQTEFGNVFKVGYSTILETARQQGYSTPVWTGASLFATSFLLFWMGGSTWASYVAGETKQPQRTFLYSVLGAQALMIVLFAAVGAASFAAFGQDFSYAANFLGNLGKSPLPATQAPEYNLLADLAVPVLGGNPITVAIVFILLAAGSYCLGPMQCLGASRKIFAWSFDRLLPSKFSEVSERFKSPIYSAIVISLLAELFAVLEVYGPGIMAVVGGIGVVYSGVIWGVGSFSGLVFPTRKELFQQAPPLVRAKIGPIPVISILGLIGFLGIAGIDLFGQIVPAVEGGVPPLAAAWTAGVFFAGAVFYYVAKAYRRRVDGLDLSLAFKQIPPE